MVENNPLAVVTGASSGIGLELAKVFAKNGYDLLVCADEDEINRVPELIDSANQITVVQADLATEEGVEELYKKIQEQNKPVDSICINAGSDYGKAFTDQTKEQIFDMINLNVKSSTYLAYLVLQDMKKLNSGRILFTASIVSTMPSPFQAVYTSTKAYVLSLSESLRSEVKDTNITITALRPGGTDTKIFERGGLMDTAVGVMKKDDPALVAQQGYDALMANKDSVIGGSLKNKLLVAASNVTPAQIIAEQSRKLVEPGSASKVKASKRSNNS